MEGWPRAPSRGPTAAVSDQIEPLHHVGLALVEQQLDDRLVPSRGVPQQRRPTVAILRIELNRVEQQLDYILVPPRQPTTAASGRSCPSRRPAALVFIILSPSILSLASLDGLSLFAWTS